MLDLNDHRYYLSKHPSESSMNSNKIVNFMQVFTTGLFISHAPY